MRTSVHAVNALVLLALLLVMAAVWLWSRQPPSPGSTNVNAISAEEFGKHSKRRFGRSNPERMNVAVWEWMVRTGDNPFMARKHLGLEFDYRAPGDPDWCFDRMGAPSVTMPDGRVITIAGEHEDFYDPDFCIYNDVVVRQGDAVEIYGYPRDVFPPTDFHTATLVGDSIYIIGTLGYTDDSRAETTPVFRLDTADYRIEAVPTEGTSPGWLHRHRARLLASDGIIEVTGGQRVLAGDERGLLRDNFDTYHLALATGRWSRVTDHSDWRQFSLEYEDDDKTLEDFTWYTGDVLTGLGYECERYQDDFDVTGEDEDEDDSPYDEYLFERAHVLIVNGVRVRCADRYGEIRVIIEGALAPEHLDELLRKLKEAARVTHRNVTAIVEL